MGLKDFLRQQKGAGLAAQTLRPGERPNLTPDKATEDRLDLLQAIDLIHQGFDRAADQLVAGRGGVALCRDGCGKCCLNDTPMAGAWEAQHAVSTMAAPGGITLDSIERARDWLTMKHPAATTYPRERPIVLRGESAAAGGEFTADELTQLARERAALANTACPFLGDDLRCTVYGARPMACRSYSVTYAPEPYCERPKDEHETMHPGSFSYNPDGDKLALAVNVLHAKAAEHMPALGSSAFWPTLVFAHYAPLEFQELIAKGEIALAKLAFVQPGTPYQGLISQADRDYLGARLQEQQATAVAAPVQ